MTKPLSKSNSIIAARLRKIMQCGLPWSVLSQILVDCTNQDKEFVKYINNNGYDDIITKNKFVSQSTYSKQDYTRFPWFDEEGSLMIKESVVDEIEKRVLELAWGELIK